MAKSQKSTSNARAREASPSGDGPAAEWLATASLREWPDNPRMNDDNVARVAASIQRFGFGAPIVARRDGLEIIAGHTRWLAAQMLGLERVPVRLMDLPEREAHILALADNRLTELSPWSVPDLQQLLSGLDLAEVELAGWSSADLQRMADDMLAKDGDFPALPGEPTHIQMTFTVSHRQKAVIDAAVARAKKLGTVADDNENSNGNAITAICEAYDG